MMKATTEQPKSELNFYVSNTDFRFLVLGWCKYMIRPFVKPFSELKYNSQFLITNDYEDQYLMRVRDVKVFDSVVEAVNETNYTKVIPDAQIMPLDLVRLKVVSMLQSPRARRYKQKHGVEPKIMVIEAIPFKDPKE